MTKKLLFLLLAAILPVMASAYDACIGDIYYNFDRDSKTAMVTYMSETSSNKKAYSGDVKIPSSVNYGGVEYVVEAIGDRAFYSCYDLTSVTIPHSVLYILDGAFRYSGLTSVLIPHSVTYIGDEAFAHSNVASVTIPNSVTYIGKALRGGVRGGVGNYL